MGRMQRQSGVFMLPCISGWQGLAGHQAGEVQRALAAMEPGLPYPSPPRISPPTHTQFSPISRLGRDFQTHASILFQKDSPQAMGVVREVRTRAMSHIVEGLQLQDLKRSTLLKSLLRSRPIGPLPPPPPEGSPPSAGPLGHAHPELTLFHPNRLD